MRNVSALFFVYMDISKLDDRQLIEVIKSRFESASSVWDTVKTVYDTNTIHYDCDPDRVPSHLQRVSAKSHKVRANRIFRDTESVINTLIANPPKPNVLPTREMEESKKISRTMERYLSQRYDDIDVKGEFRRGLRFLYFCRLIVMKPFWDSEINDFNVKAVDPRKVRFSPKSSNEKESEFAIEDIDCGILGLIARFPEKKEEILKKKGLSEEDAMVKNPEVSYRESWIGDWRAVTFGNIVLDRRKNPFWDWDGILLSQENDLKLADDKAELGKEFWKGAEAESEELKEVPEEEREAQGISSFMFNHFDRPRKPYIFATVLNDEKRPIGRTSFIEQAIPLQESIDRRKRQIDDNARMVNGITKVDSSVMTQAEARKIGYDAEGLIWGKGVVTGVQRETGTPLPNFVYEDMVDSRSEIDNIMAASSAFRGEREGSETKAGRLALIEQSYLNLNEMVQVVDYVSREMFNWMYQLAKVNYTETHYAKMFGPQGASETMELHRNDLAEGAEIRVIPGKTLPEDRKFMFERAQSDKDILAPNDYFEQLGYEDPKGLAMRFTAFQADPFAATGVEPPPPEIAPPEELQQ